MSVLSIAGKTKAQGGHRAQFLVVGGAIVAAFLLYNSMSGSSSTSTSKSLAAGAAAKAAATPAAAARTETPAASYPLTARDPFAFAVGADGKVAAGSPMEGNIIAAETTLLGAQKSLTALLAGRPSYELANADAAAAVPGATFLAPDASPATGTELSMHATVDDVVLASRAASGDCFLVQISKAQGGLPVGYARTAMATGATCRADAANAVTFAPDQLDAGWLNVG